MDPRHDVSVDGGADSRETKSLAMCRTHTGRARRSKKKASNQKFHTTAVCAGAA